MSDTAQQKLPRRPSADLVITLLLLVLFGWALWTSLEWSFRAALFPRMVAVAGLLLVLLNLSLLVARSAGLAPAESESPGPAVVAGDDEAEAQELEYEFAHTSRRNWLVNIGWVAGFFCAVYVAGLFLIAPVFSLLYLRIAAGRTWRFAATYALVVGAVLYGFFDQTLAVSMPLGIVQS